MPTPTVTPPAAPDRSSCDAIGAYVALLAGEAQPHELLELRFRFRTGGMARRFYPARNPGGLVEAIHRLGSRCDVYVGCAPRTHRSGGRDAIDRAWVLWAECDLPAAHAAVEAFTPAPTLVIASGSPHGRHAYWALTSPADAVLLEDANRRLAHALGADPVCVDAARILRPPGTHNFKRDQPAWVGIVAHRPERRYRLDELLDPLPELPASPEPAAGATTDARRRDGDPLLTLTPDEYLPVLLGQPIGRDRKVTCPFHEDQTPSLHAYPDHWYCFSCRAGGTIYDLAARLWFSGQSSATGGRGLRGAQFVEVRERLLAMFSCPNGGVSVARYR
jgi:hypothetical protein